MAGMVNAKANAEGAYCCDDRGDTAQNWRRFGHQCKHQACRGEYLSGLPQGTAEAFAQGRTTSGTCAISRSVKLPL